MSGTPDIGRAASVNPSACGISGAQGDGIGARRVSPGTAPSALSGAICTQKTPVDGVFIVLSQSGAGRRQGKRTPALKVKGADDTHHVDDARLRRCRPPTSTSVCPDAVVSTTSSGTCHAGLNPVPPSAATTVAKVALDVVDDGCPVRSN